MATGKQVSRDVFPYLRVYDDGTIERLAGTEVTPAGLDSKTGVLSKDIVIIPETNVSARLYRPDSAKGSQKLPVMVYFHGGAFCIASTAEPKYQNCLNMLVSEANIFVVSVDYRLVPEHPLDVVYQDSWDALQWLASHANEKGGNEPWLQDYADFDQLFLAGDSAGANIAHHMALRLNNSKPTRTLLKIRGIAMIHPYFWGKNPIGVEVEDSLRKPMVDNWWTFVCPSEKGCDDPLINPFVDGAPGLNDLACDSVLVFIAEKDILRSRGKLYYDGLIKSGWKGKAEIVETKGEDHVFHIFDADCENARVLIKRWASFVNQK
ncbi:hypothetical protein K2173_027995 [Erythroxylum novogranatense]|uniref:Alpha/beta hydrolase fold-3 domain-containing protein n=1 Tax=Erythroxylum novogranatense TaxID=1862640 RepID=A0AAV8U4J1_9ROSI|nr:hypothetical protein K2173_027995 [Erythroxylum novogranatense]